MFFTIVKLNTQILKINFFNRKCKFFKTTIFFRLSISKLRFYFGKRYCQSMDKKIEKFNYTLK